jgi:hypothetical protein
MTIIKEVVCSKCGRKQVENLEDLLKANLFWRTCEFCQRYGLYRTIRQKMTSLSDWLTALYHSMDLTPFEKCLVSSRKE